MKSKNTTGCNKLGAKRPNGRSSWAEGRDGHIAARKSNLTIDRDYSVASSGRLPREQTYFLSEVYAALFRAVLGTLSFVTFGLGRPEPNIEILGI